MKPPFRRRTEPSRFMLKSTKEEPTVNTRSLCKGWARKDLQSFLQALKRQQNFESELDLTEIQKKVPNRSLKEVNSFVTKFWMNMHMPIVMQLLLLFGFRLKTC